MLTATTLANFLAGCLGRQFRRGSGLIALGGALLAVYGGVPACARKGLEAVIYDRGSSIINLSVRSRFMAADRNEQRGGESIDSYVRRFESSYRDVRTLQAEFTQVYTSFGRPRIESGRVHLARGGRMLWDYRQPESKLFLSDGKQLLLYVPAEKQLTRSPMKTSEDIRVPLSVLLSRLEVRKVFSKIEFAGQAPEVERGNRVLRAYPKRGHAEDYRDVLIELTPAFDIRRLVISYPDNSTMQFTFSRIERNVALAPSLFQFTPPAGTEVIQQ